MDEIRLNNGLKCILEKREGAGVVAVQVWVRVGSKYEEPRIAGITHLIEHLIFKGTEKEERYEIAPRIEALGGTINAFTSYDNTVYHIVVPKDGFETGFKLLVTAVRHPQFPEEELAKEKGVVIQEIKMGEDNPQRKLFKELFSLGYKGHPYGRPIIGYEETVNGISREDIRTYFQKYYRLDNMAVLIVGDFDEQKARGFLEQHLSEKEEKAEPAPGQAAQAGIGEGRISVIRRNVRESYLAYSYPIPPLMHRDIPALEVLSNILGNGESSRLQKELKDKRRLVTNSGTYLFTPREGGLFIMTATFKGSDHEAVVKGMEGEVKRLLKHGPDPWEMEKAKNQVRASYVYSAETVQGRAREVGYYETISDDAFFGQKYLKKLDRVSTADVKRVLKKYIEGRNKELAVILPQVPSNPTTMRLSNGLSVVVNQNRATPSFSFMIGFTGGMKEEPEGKNGSFTVLSKMLLKGTKSLDARAIARKIDALAGEIIPVSGRNVFGLSGKFLAKDLPEVLSLLNELLTATVLRAEELKRVKDEVLSEIRQREDEPASYTLLRMNRLFYRGHPYGRDALGNAEEVERLTLADIKGLYREYVTPQGAVLALSGAVDRNEVEKAARNLFSSWRGKSHPLRRLEYRLPEARNLEIGKEIAQTHLVFSFSSPGLTDEDRYAVEIMDAVLSGMGGRIYKRLREERPYAYSLTFFNQMAYETGAMGVYLGTEQKYVADVRKVLKKEIEDLREKGFTTEEVEKARRYLIGTHYIRMQTNSSVASSMCLDTIYGLGPNSFKVWPKRIEGVKKEDVDRAIKKYLLWDRMVEVSVGPAAR